MKLTYWTLRQPQPIKSLHRNTGCVLPRETALAIGASRGVGAAAADVREQGERPVQGAYEPEAASKNAGEQALRVRAQDFEKPGNSFVVVSGGMIEGTITPKLLEHKSRGVVESRRDQVGSPPTVDEFARVIVDAVSNPENSAPIVFVGATE